MGSPDISPESSPSVASRRSPTSGRPGPDRLLAIGATILSVIAIVLSMVALSVHPSGSTINPATTLGPGVTETGVYAAFGGGNASNPSFLGTSVTFAPAAQRDILSINVTFLAAEAPYTASCPGPGEAVAGHLCVYELQSSYAAFIGIEDPTTGSSNVNRTGFAIVFEADSGEAYSTGTWALTGT